MTVTYFTHPLINWFWGPNCENSPSFLSDIIYKSSALHTAGRFRDSRSRERPLVFSTKGVGVGGLGWGNQDVEAGCFVEFTRGKPLEVELDQWSPEKDLTIHPKKREVLIPNDTFFFQVLFAAHFWYIWGGWNGHLGKHLITKLAYWVFMVLRKLIITPIIISRLDIRLANRWNEPTYDHHRPPDHFQRDIPYVWNCCINDKCGRRTFLEEGPGVGVLGKSLVKVQKLEFCQASAGKVVCQTWCIFK